MTKRALTPLQRQMYGVKTIRETVRIVVAEKCGAYPYFTGYIRVWDEIIKDAFIADMTENNVRDFLYVALYDSNTPPEDRRQIEKILHLR